MDNRLYPITEEKFAAILDIISPYFTKPEDWFGGVQRFDSAPVQALRQVLEIVPELGDDRQNDAPTFAHLVQMAEPNGRLFGYIVKYERDDCRVSVDAILTTVDHLEEIQSFFPDEVNHDDKSVYAWWD